MSEGSIKEKTYRIPCSWQCYGERKIEAESLEEAMKIADEGPLPYLYEYVDASFEVDVELAEYYAEEDHRHPPDEEVIE